jgi:hypothetical protein
MASTGMKLPFTAIAETLAKVDSCANVNGVGVVVGCAYSDAVKPANTLFGSAMIKNPQVKLKNTVLCWDVYCAIHKNIM